MVRWEPENLRLRGKLQRVFGLEISQNSKLKNITHFSKLYLTQNPKLKIFVWLQYLKTVPHISILNFFTFWQSPQPAQVRRLVFSPTYPLLFPFTQYYFVFLSPQSHAEPKRKVLAFFFSYNKSFCFASFQVCESEKLCTDSLLFQILSSPPITL